MIKGCMEITETYCCVLLYRGTFSDHPVKRGRCKEICRLYGEEKMGCVWRNGAKQRRSRTDLFYPYIFSFAEALNS